VSSSDHSDVACVGRTDVDLDMEFWRATGGVSRRSGGKRRGRHDRQALDFTPAFSPDGKTLAFSAHREGTALHGNSRTAAAYRLDLGRFTTTCTD